MQTKTSCFVKTRFALLNKKECVFMTSTKKIHDWGLIIVGILLILLSIFLLSYPGLTLVTIATVAGAGFLVSGVLDIVFFARFRKSMGLSGWTLAYAILDIIIGLMFLIHPIALSGVIPWLAGIFFVVFGIFEISASIRAHSLGGSIWGWMLFSGIISVLCGITFFASPATFVIFLAVFVIMRGASLIVYGWNAGSASIVG